MGYTDVHFAVKDTFSLASFLATIFVWVAFGALLVALAIPIILVGAIVLVVRCVRRRNVQQAEAVNLASGTPAASSVANDAGRNHYVTFHYSGGHTYLTGGHNRAL